jgi:hypothetical protein
MLYLFRALNRVCMPPLALAMNFTTRRVSIYAFSQTPLGKRGSPDGEPLHATASVQ